MNKCNRSFTIYCYNIKNSKVYFIYCIEKKQTYDHLCGEFLEELNTIVVPYHIKDFIQLGIHTEI